MRRPATRLWWVTALCLCSGVGLFDRPTRGGVVRFQIQRREPFADGKSFGEVGPYERIIGKVHFSLDPASPVNRSIVDLQFAERDAGGKVTFSTDLFILAPEDLRRGNGALLYDVNNRGNKLALRFFNDAPGGNNPQQPGNGFLMRRGFTIVWSGWDGELLAGNGRLRLDAPVARRRDGPITGLVRYEIITDRQDQRRLNINGNGHGAYRPTQRGLRDATLTWRLRPGDRRVPIPRGQFRLHLTEPEGGGLPRIDLELPAGFRPGYLYELIYEAQDPLVHGVCFASVRDLISALKHGSGAANPLAPGGQPAIQRAYGFGVSQSGRFLRELLYAGFNQDEQGRRVFDGLMPHVAGGGLGSFNHRFAQPTAYATQHAHHDWPTDRFPFSYQTQTDPLTGQTDGILRRATEAGVAPLVIHTQSSTEYWSRSGSLVHTDPLGLRDVPPLEGVRIFAFGGTQHGPSSYPPRQGIGQWPVNPADYRPLLRALLVALDRWARGQGPAPPSVYPTIAGGTLVDWSQKATRFPAAAGVRYPEVIQQPALWVFGPRWPGSGIMDLQPPELAASYRVRVPRCGPDGNELGCLLPPEVAVPLATFTGWNLRAAPAGAEDELVGLSGCYLPLPATDAERAASGDPRPSLQSLYGTLPRYIQRLEQYCRQLVRQGYLLEEDVEPIIRRQRKRAEKLLPPT